MFQSKIFPKSPKFSPGVPAVPAGFRDSVYHPLLESLHNVSIHFKKKYKYDVHKVLTSRNTLLLSCTVIPIMLIKQLQNALNGIFNLIK